MRPAGLARVLVGNSPGRGVQRVNNCQHAGSPRAYWSAMPRVDRTGSQAKARHQLARAYCVENRPAGVSRPCRISPRCRPRPYPVIRNRAPLSPQLGKAPSKQPSDNPGITQRPQASPPMAGPTGRGVGPLARAYCGEIRQESPQRVKGSARGHPRGCVGVDAGQSVARCRGVRVGGDRMGRRDRRRSPQRRACACRGMALHSDTDVSQRTIGPEPSQ